MDLQHEVCKGHVRASHVTPPRINRFVRMTIGGAMHGPLHARPVCAILSHPMTAVVIYLVLFVCVAVAPSNISVVRR